MLNKEQIDKEKINNKFLPDPNSFFWIAAPSSDAAANNHNDVKTNLANGLCTFFTKGKPVISNKTYLKAYLKAYLKILLIVLFSGIEFLIILY